jgi:hypothetical protein
MGRDIRGSRAASDAWKSKNAAIVTAAGPLSPEIVRRHCTECGTRLGLIWLTSSFGVGERCRRIMDAPICNRSPQAPALILRDIRTLNRTNRRRRVHSKTLLRPNSSAACWRRIFFSVGGLVAATTCSLFHHRYEYGMVPPSRHSDKTTPDKTTQLQKKYCIENS